MTRPDNTAASWPEVAGQLTPEQAAQFELSERSGDDPATLMAMARELAAALLAVADETERLA
jgi:hypothetical protein